MPNILHFKWIISVDGKDDTDDEILKRIEFQEKYYDTRGQSDQSASLDKNRSHFKVILIFI